MHLHAGMEKFSVFNDRVSGVNPFTLQPYRPPPGARAKAVVLQAARVPLLALAWGGLRLAALLPPLLRQPVERLLAAIVLWAMGVRVTEETVLKQQVRVAPSKSAPLSAVHGGDIIVANQCSYIDLLVLAAKYGALFSVPVAGTGGLREAPLAEAIAATFGCAFAASKPAAKAATPTSSSSSTAALANTDKLITALAARRHGPLVVFPEGAPSNNRAVLEFSPAADELAACCLDVALAKGPRAKLRVPTCHIVALRYSYARGAGGGRGDAGGDGALSRSGGASASGGANLAGLESLTAPPPVYIYEPGLTPFRHAIRLAGHPSTGVTLSRLPQGFDPQPADFLAAAAAVGGGTESSTTGVTASKIGVNGGAGEGAPAAPSTWSAAARAALVQLLRGGVRAVEIKAADYHRYVALCKEAAAGPKAHAPHAKEL